MSVAASRVASAEALVEVAVSKVEDAESLAVCAEVLSANVFDFSDVAVTRLLAAVS